MSKQQESAKENHSVAPPTPPRSRKRKALLAAGIFVTILALLAGIVYLIAPRIMVAGFEIKQTRDDWFSFTLNLTVENRLPFDIRIGGYAFDLDVNGDRLAEKVENIPIELPGWETTNVPITIEGKESELPEWLRMGRRISPSRRDYEYKLSGWITMTRPFYHRQEFTYSGTFPGFAMPDIVIAGIRVVRFDLFNPEVDLNLEFINPNGIPITHDHFTAEVIINGIPVGHVSKPEPVTYAPYAHTVTPFRFNMESLRGGAAFAKIILQGGEVRAHVKGRVMVRMEGFGYYPFDFDSEAPAPVDLGSFSKLGVPVPR